MSPSQSLRRILNDGDEAREGKEGGVASSAAVADSVVIREEGVPLLN